MTMNGMDWLFWEGTSKQVDSNAWDLSCLQPDNTIQNNTMSGAGAFVTEGRR